MRAIRWLLAAALLLAPSVALAQSTLLQAGTFTGGHAPMYVGPAGQSQAIVQDSGTAAGGGVGLGFSELLLTARGTGTAPYASQGTGILGTNFCSYDAPTTNATGYHYLCFSPNAQGGGLIAYGAGGTATALPLQFIVNGTTYQFPFTTSGVIGPATTVVNDAACWNNTVGTLLKDCGGFVTVGGTNAWTGANSWSGASNFTGTFQIASVTQTFPASGNIVGTSDAQTLTNKTINASQISVGTLPATVMPAFTGDITSSAGSVATTLANSVVTNAKLAPASSANTIKGAATSTTVTDLAAPSCSGAGNALQWLTGTGLQCGTITATTAGFGLTLSGGGVMSISTSAPPYGYDMPVNMGMSASVGASALTINLTTANGSTPSATNPVLIPFRSGTLATGTTLWGAITGALSIVVPSAATLGTSNSVPFRIWLFATYNAGVPQLGVAVCSSSVTIYPCSAWEFTRKTSIAIDGFSASSGVLYATAAVSNDPVRMIGFAEYSAGLATAGAWASVPTTLQAMGPGIKRPGEVIQTVAPAFGTTTVVTFTTTPTSTNVTANITPTSAVNLIRYSALTTMAASGANNVQMAQMYRGSTAIGAVGAMWSSVASLAFSLPFSGLDAPFTTSATTYVLKGGFAGTTGTGSIPAVNTQSATEVLEEIQGALPEPANDNIDPGVFALTG